MNTDNMTISGETIDYGPCAFMDSYDPETVFSSIDHYGRYAYKNQPIMAQWNLMRFAETLLPLLHQNEDQAIQIAEDSVLQFTDLYHCNWIAGMRAKLGIFNGEPEDESLIQELLDIMEKHNADYTNTFRALTFDKLRDAKFFSTEEFTQWNKRWQTRLERQQESKESSHELMRNNNPALIPRNHRVEEDLKAAAKEDYSVMENLVEVLLSPYAHLPEQDQYAKLPPPSHQPYRTFCGT